MDIAMAMRRTHKEIKSEIRAIYMSAKDWILARTLVEAVRKMGTDSSWKP